jgi:hypothetical protein
MDSARTLSDYRAVLDALLDDVAQPLTDAERSALREIVRQRRNGRRGQPQMHAAPHVCERADEIVDLLSVAARELRPRETQQLDDLVAGRPPRTDELPNSFPVRPRRSGRSSR